MGTPAFRATMELDLARLYAMTRPQLAIECAAAALTFAIEAERPDLQVRALEILAVFAPAA